MGLRGFADPNNMRGSLTSPQVLGTFVADWQWVPCSTSHLQCAVLFNALGYEGSAMLPLLTRGYNVNTLVPNNNTGRLTWEFFLVVQRGLTKPKPEVAG